MALSLPCEVEVGVVLERLLERYDVVGQRVDLGFQCINLGFQIRNASECSGQVTGIPQPIPIAVVLGRVREVWAVILAVGHLITVRVGRGVAGVALARAARVKDGLELC